MKIMTLLNAPKTQFQFTESLQEWCFLSALCVIEQLKLLFEKQNQHA